ncbi:MAG: hypothetical protein PHV68_04890 [Candidatus Gastranaerophilales bacterium]|nr:hypothetical protein [Candidatus Gastranaerophilales bacterium]
MQVNFTPISFKSTSLLSKWGKKVLSNSTPTIPNKIIAAADFDPTKIANNHRKIEGVARKIMGEIIKKNDENVNALKELYQIVTDKKSGGTGFIEQAAEFWKVELPKVKK